MRPRALPLSAWVLAAFALVLSSRVALAQPSTRPMFAVQVAAERSEAIALQAVLRDVVSGQAVELAIAVVARIEPATVIRGPGTDRAHPPLGRAFVDLSDPARATVYVVDGTWQRILVRHVPRTTNPDVVLETVGRIVSTAVEALLAGSFVRYSEPVDTFESKGARGTTEGTTAAAQGTTAGSQEPIAPGASRGASEPGDRGAPSAEAASLERAERAPIEPPSADRAPSERASSEPRRSGRALSGRVGAMYEVGLHSSARALVHGPALYGALAFGGGSTRPAVWLTGQYRWPVVADDAPIGYRLNTAALRILGGTELDVSPRVTLELGAGIGVDIVRVEPRRASVNGDVWLAPDRSFVVGLARVMAGVRWRLARSISAHALAFADIDASRTRLVFDESQGAESVLSFYAVRPGLAVAVSVP